QVVRGELAHDAGPWCRARRLPGLRRPGDEHVVSVRACRHGREEGVDHAGTSADSDRRAPGLPAIVRFGELDERGRRGSLLVRPGQVDGPTHPVDVDRWVSVVTEA